MIFFFISVSSYEYEKDENGVEKPQSPAWESYTVCQKSVVKYKTPKITDPIGPLRYCPKFKALTDELYQGKDFFIFGQNYSKTFRPEFEPIFNMTQTFCFMTYRTDTSRSTSRLVTPHVSN